MQFHIPQYLHRGDNDFKGVRKLRDTINGYQLLTNLLNGGDGRQIKEKPLIDLIDRHVSTNWSTTHFLSFSENERTSLRFGLHCEIEEVDNLFIEYGEYGGCENNWDFAIVSIDTGKINWTRIDKGVYKGIYPSNRISNTLKNEVILLDVRQILKKYTEYEKSKINSERDEEWLILPFNKFQSKENELSAIFDISDILLHVTKYKKGYSESIFL
ncbi:hypothetical protein [Labilibacter marinus]|uniref:hypothetical protein n=1 Tax=Labilibacter marinus TaxID=1477105 RepID=UPI00094F9572|nr:hypothetical protein [Labilibacter marinus]